ncbi:type II secretion system F family protein [Paenibacillus sp.]|uniref:type II secretion system F family protein n=1 Tax=Paenibacillus sp. TaxID=58172 RepID=UPI002D4A35D5|nr:type II secretion system F family protein [Paenibacillus sp.]HZG58590.1 type II secretion system F family protein [Paenibacillus sp.]
MAMLCAALFVTVTLTIYGLYLVPHERKQRVKQRLSRLSLDGPAAEPAPADEARGPGPIRRLLHGAGLRLRRRFRRRMDERKQERLETLLLRAGRPMQMTPVEFRLLQLAAMVAVPGLTGAYAWFLLRGGFGTTALLTMLGALAAWRLPYLYLGGKAKKRAKQALRELPDVLDLLTVSLEAGLGFDAALGKLVSKKSGVLADEFYRCLEEIRLGRTRREALLGLRERVGLDEMRTLVSSILQAEKLGIGLVQVLRVQSAELRDRRKQRAEEAAMKAPIKMLFPLVLFVFPCLFIVLLGPVLIQFMDTFGASGGGMP